jgi:hypothetical protein
MAELDPRAAYGEDKGYMVHENNYMSIHPVGNPKVGNGMGPFHPSAIHQHLANDHGGARTAGHVRQDIRTGFEILKKSGSSGGMLHAENLGYEARKHHYLEAEKNQPKPGK